MPQAAARLTEPRRRVLRGVLIGGIGALMVAVALLVGSVAMSLALPFSWIDPSPKGLFFFALIGVTSGIGHFATIKALEYAPASLLAPFAYIQLLWVSILGVLVFGDFPDAVTLIGMGVVVAGGLLIAASRRRQGRNSKVKTVITQ